MVRRVIGVLVIIAALVALFTPMTVDVGLREFLKTLLQALAFTAAVALGAWLLTE